MNESRKKIFEIIVLTFAVLIGFYFVGILLLEPYFLKKGEGLLQKAEFDAAKRDLKIALFLGPRDPMVHALLGKATLGEPVFKPEYDYPHADLAGASSYYEKAISLNLKEKNPILYTQGLENLGFVYWKLKQYEKSNSVYLAEIAFDPQNTFWPRYSVALNDIDILNKPSEALEVLPPALTSKNFYPDFLYRIHIQLARLYLYQENYKELEKYISLAETNLPSGANNSYESIIHALKAQLYGFKKNFIAAEAEVKKANELGNSQHAYNCVLAQAYLNGADYAMAADTAKNALRLIGQPSSYAHSICLSVLGNTFSLQKNKEEATKYFTQYLTLTDKFESKNIFVIRERNKILLYLKSSEAF